LHFYVVSDGMGGHTGGEIASVLTIDTMRQYLQTAQAQEAQACDLLMLEAGPWVLGAQKLLSAVEGANAQVFAVSHRRPDLTGMGSTVAALYFDEPRGCVTICHVGDTRVYRVRAGGIEQLTKDHSVGQQLVQAGKLNRHELANFPYRRVLTQAVGICPLIRPEVQIEALKSGDIFLICTNGVYQDVGEEKVLETVRNTGADLQQVCDRLVAAADERGGGDDETVLVLSYADSEDCSFSVPVGPDARVVPL
jgi:protein phosphatase